MANLEVLALDEATPQIRAPGSGDGYLMPRPLTLTTGTITTDINQVDGTVTWNSAGVTFTGWKLNVTDTASAAASLLVDLQINGSPKHRLNKAGQYKSFLTYTDESNNAFVSQGWNSTSYEILATRVGTDAYPGSIKIGRDAAFWQVGGSGAAFILAGNTTFQVSGAGTGAVIENRAYYAWSANINAVTSPDLFLYRDGAAGTLAQRNTTNAQTSRLYRTYTDASNYQRLTQTWSTSTAVIHNEGAGTGADGSVAFNDAALATDATKGFVMIPSCAGTPTGTPADIPTGQVPIVFDSTNNKLYVYDGGWLATAALT